MLFCISPPGIRQVVVEPGLCRDPNLKYSDSYLARYQCYNGDMNAPSPTFIELLNEMDHWVLDNDVIIATSLFTDKNKPRISVCEKELAQYHPDLPQALRTMLLRRKEHENKNWAEASQVRNTYHLLTGKYLVFQCITGKSLMFEKVTSLAAPGHFLDHGMISLCGYRLHVREHHGIVFSDDIHWQQSTVSKADMDLRYPGWEQRWQIAEDLGVETEIMYKHVFENTTHDNVAVGLSDCILDTNTLGQS